MILVLFGSGLESALEPDPAGSLCRFGGGFCLPWSLLLTPSSESLSSFLEELGGESRTFLRSLMLRVMSRNRILTTLPASGGKTGFGAMATKLSLFLPQTFGLDKCMLAGPCTCKGYFALAGGVRFDWRIQGYIWQVGLHLARIS